MENTVYCNISYYDSEGRSVKYEDTITVYTLKPGWKTQYKYTHLGYLPVYSDSTKQSLVDAGWNETVMSVRNDTVLLNLSHGVSSIKLPMSYFNDCDTLVFKYASISLCDTLYISQQGYPHVESPECGSYRFHTITGIRHTDAAIDSVLISNPSVNYEGNENIKIYFHGEVE